MRRVLFVALGAALLFVAPGVTPSQPPLPGPSKPTPDSPDKKFEDFNKVVQGAKEYDGLFKLYHKDEHLFAEIRPDQLDKPLMCPIAIAKGASLGGFTLNFDEQWVLVFKRVGDKVHLVRRNVRFQAKGGSPSAKAVETTYTDSVLMAIPIRTINLMRQSVVIDLNHIFMTDFADLGFGHFDANRSTWHKVRAFPKNLELQVAATFSGGRFFRGDDSVIDPRGNTVVIHYGLVQMPDSGYQPRVADDRVGYFLSVTKDFSSDSKDTSFVRHVNRWRLERAEPIDPKNPGKLSAPKKKIVYWIEKSVPDEYRAHVREGILEWNKAFEKIGFRDAIEVRQQEDDTSGEFDPEDIRFSTFRWITTDSGFAMGPSRANPLTGEIIDADIIFDASMVRYWKQEYKLLKGEAIEPASTIQAIREGQGIVENPLLMRGHEQSWNEPRKNGDRKSEAEAKLEARMRAIRQGFCQCGAHMRHELGMAALALGASGGDKSATDKAMEEMIGQAIKEVTMHEVGHTLGLRHNFKASTMLRHDQLNDTSVTRAKGQSGSVMDYNPANIAPKGVKQGDYFSTTIGPYDYWAIEYAYRPLPGGTDGEGAELKKIAVKGASPGHDYGTDEDMFGTSDPLINAFDLGADPMKYAQDRIALAEELLKGLSDRVVENGEGYQRARTAFSVLLGQYGNAAYLIAGHIGSEHAHRDHRGDPSARDPIVPVKMAKQREALKLLQDHILTEKPFTFSPQLLRRLAADRWWHWGNERAVFSSVDYPIYERILRIQQIPLYHLTDPAVLYRIQNSSLKVEKDEQPLTIAEVFKALTESIWSELPKGGEKKDVGSSIIRRNLQREYVKLFSRMVLGPKQNNEFGYSFLMGPSAPPPDARSLARMHLRDLNKRMERLLSANQPGVDDTTRAHLEECQERIAKVLGASVQVND